ncbi:MAG: hypothetical protein ABIN96_12345 [Rubrivivax sp.]
MAASTQPGRRWMICADPVNRPATDALWLDRRIGAPCALGHAVARQPGISRQSGAVPNRVFTLYSKETVMTKILSTLLLAAFAFSAQAASHAGGAPMKAASAASAASGAMMDKKMDKMDKKDMKKDEMKKDDMKKDGMKK